MERGYNHDPEFTVMGEPRDRETNVYPHSLSASLLFTAVSVCVSASAPLSDPLCHVPALLSLSAPPPSLLFLIVSLSRAALYFCCSTCLSIPLLFSLWSPPCHDPPRHVSLCLSVSLCLPFSLWASLCHVPAHYFSVCLCLSPFLSPSGPVYATLQHSTFN